MRTWCASILRGSSGRRQTIPKREICLKCRIAVPGSDPATKYTSDDGDVWDSFRVFCSVLLYCWSIQATSFLVRTRLASPDKSTGVPYSVIIRKEAAGLDLLPLASPQVMTEPSAFLKADILARMFGMFPSVDLNTPTCSASSTKSIVFPFICIGL